MFSETLVSNILYSIINSALLNTLNAKAYLTYLFSEFKDKEMDDPSVSIKDFHTNHKSC